MYKKIFLLPLFFLGIILSSYSQNQLKKDTLLARTNVVKADSLFNNDNLEEAMGYYSNAATMYSKYALWLNRFACQVRIVESQSRLGLYAKALELSEQIAIEIASKKMFNTVSEGTLLNQIGFIHLNKGRNDLALENIQKSISILSGLKKIDKLSLAASYNNLGLVYWNSANGELALEHLQKSLTTRIEVYGENHSEVADAYNNIGLIYSSSDNDKALLYYTKALKIYQALYPSSHSKVTNTITNSAIIQRKQKKYDEALVNFQKVLSIWAQDKNRHPKEGFVYSNVGEVYLDKSEIEKAIELKLKALQMYKEIYGEKHPEIASVYNQLGSIFMEQNKSKMALTYFQNALNANSVLFSNKNLDFNPSVNDYYNSSLLLQSLQLKARALEQYYSLKTLKTTNLKLALTTYFSCDTLIEKIRKVQSNKNDKIELGKKAASIYEDAIRVCMLLKDVTPKKKMYSQIAFYFSEKSKTAVLLEAISDAEAKHFANIPDSLLEREKSIKSEISFFEQKLAEKKDTLNEKFFRDKLFEYNRLYEGFVSGMEKDFPEYYNLKYSVKTSTVKSIQATLAKGTALVSYFIADDSKRVYVYFISKNKYKVFDVPENDRLNKLIIGFRNSIKVEAEEVYLETANSLYNQLIPFSIPKSLTKLIIIPDGKVGTIPFEALLTKRIKSGGVNYSTLPYLLKKCEVTYSYSANLFEQAQLKTVRESGDMFLCAPIDFSGYTKMTLSNLPATENEVSSIKKMFTEKGVSCSCFTGKAVQESMLKSTKLVDYKYLHFATHGIVDEISPELSEIYLSPDTAKLEDGNLYSGEIYNLKINADLVTLSACQTGLGKIQKGEGIIGLSRALLYAGAKNLVVSLWSVADKSTSLLMIDFYTQLLNDNKRANYSSYIRDSKLKMINEGQFNKPYYWAPFILVGK